MKSIKDYCRENATRLIAAAVLCGLCAGASAFGVQMEPTSISLMAAPFILGEIKMDDIEKAISAASQSVKETTDRMQQALDQALAETKRLETITGKTNEELKTASGLAKQSQDSLKSVMDRVLEVEQKIAKRHGGGNPDAGKSWGELVVSSDAYKAAQEREGKRSKPEMESVNVGSWHKTAILSSDVSASGAIGILSQATRVAGIVTPPERQLIVRNLLPVYSTDSNMIEFCRELLFTNNAAPQGGTVSPTQAENQTKAESGITFQLAQAPVITLAHWIPASRQVLADAKMLMSYIDQRLRYGVLLEEEDEVLNGDNTAGQLNGLVNQATAYSQQSTHDTRLDTLLKAFLQVTLSDFAADGVVMSWVDWVQLLLVKDTQGRYIFGNPASPMQSPQCWGRPVVPTNSMTTNTFLVGAFQLAAALWDREQATVRVSESHSDFFIRNMVAVLAEERVALTVYRPSALVTGNFATAGAG